jgi:D-alanyl-D-alanine carboxypeptidase
MFVRMTRTGRASLFACLVVTAAGTLLLSTTAGAAHRGGTTRAVVQRLLDRLVATPGGPVGAIVTLYNNGKTTVLSAGRADATRPGAPRPGDHMRLASVTKAFTGAIALRLVQQGRLGLDDTIGKLLPRAMPRDWSKVTMREMLGHTSGLPDYTRSAGFVKQVTENPHGYVSPMQVVGWVRNKDLEFTPGSSYEYSNTDNIVVGLIEQRLTGRSFGQLLSTFILRPAGLTQTTFPTRRISLPTPFIHGYTVKPGQPPQDDTTFLSPSGAWASGAIVSTPTDLGAFIRADLAGRFFGSAQRRQQLRFVAGSSSPPGPATNSAGLAIFRYQTPCGTVYGHTGNFPGYVQWAAATANGRRSVTTSLNIAAPTGALLTQLRSLQAAAVCTLLGR